VPENGCSIPGNFRNKAENFVKSIAKFSENIIFILPKGLIELFWWQNPRLAYPM